MPFVKVHTVKGALNAEEKARIKEQITDTMVAVEGGGDRREQHQVRAEGGDVGFHFRPGPAGDGVVADAAFRARTHRQ